MSQVLLFYGSTITETLSKTYVVHVRQTLYIENGIRSVYEIDGDFLRKGPMFRERDHAELDIPPKHTHDCKYIQTRALDAQSP